MKKVVACLLASCLILQSPLSVLDSHAMRVSEVEVGQLPLLDEATSELQKTIRATPSEGEATSSKSGKGVVQVEVNSVLPMYKNIELSVVLDAVKRDGSNPQNIAVESIVIDKTAGSKSVEIRDLAPGKYQLVVSGDGYETYTQTLEVANDTSKILLVNDYLAGYTFDSSSKHPGVIKLGDTNGDGVIDLQDKEDLILAINQKSSESRFDFNGDGTVDLIDLQYFSIFYENTNDSRASVTKMITVNTDKVTSSVASNTKAEGNIEDVFGGKDSHVSFSPTNDTDISDSNPVEFSMDFQEPIVAQGFTIVPPSNSENIITGGEVVIAYEEGGVEKEILAQIQQADSRRTKSTRSGAATVTQESDGTLVLDLGKQVAVKKVSFKVTSTSGNKLADISKVEFLNDMEDRIPAPDLSIPENVTGIPGSEEFTVTWDPTSNVTGYVVEVTHEKGVDILHTKINRVEVTSFKGDDILNGDSYTVRVQSVSGDWKSQYSQSITVIPEPDSVPPAPEYVEIVGGYQKLEVSWRKMKDTDSYTLFYKASGASDDTYVSVPNLLTPQYTIEGLEDETSYDVYLVGHNKLGQGPRSNMYSGKTASLLPTITPNYKLINVPVEGKEVTDHIVDVTYHVDHTTPENNNDSAKKFVVVDNDYTTSWVRNDWDSGGSYGPKSPIVEFDQAYEMDTIIFTPDDNQKYSYSKARIFAENANGVMEEIPGTLSLKRDENGKQYYVFQSANPFTTRKVQVNVSVYGSGPRISYSEMKFYYYDSLESEVNNLFTNSLHTTIQSSVTQATIDDLRARLQVKDSVSDEYHPKKELLEKELETAELILNDTEIGGNISIDPTITKSRDGHLGFRSGLNAWQPLGVTALANETVVFYVGHPTKRTGEETQLRVISTQYHPEVSSWHEVIKTPLKVGRNEIVIPKLTSLSVEQGGQLYIEYTGNNVNDNYEVRISGGNQIPVLDITKGKTEAERKALVKAYIQELEAYVPKIQEKHDILHPDHTFDEVNCILGATDIVMKYMMYSVSAKQILAGSVGSTTDEKAESLYQSLLAMEGMMELFYQHKGLSNAEGAGDRNRLPHSRFNIRYHRMFAGAFMYAGGLHIGIEWGSVPGLAGSVPIQSTPEGKYQSGRYFGWGIAHEIGHILNEGAYSVAEVTNNYYAILAQAKDTNDSIRAEYPEIYKKVTSGAIGRSSNVFTQLGMYWQLHLAYDKGGYNYKTFDNYQEQFDNLFFARVDSYVRTQSKAPQPGGIPLTLNGTDADNALMRLASAAAEKNLLEFFERWGMVPNSETKAYVSQFPKETRAIYLVNDEARVYELENGPDGSIITGVNVEGTLDYTEGSNRVTISGISNDAATQNAMLGYEIFRSEKHKDETKRYSVGFIMADETEFVDEIATVNNRAFTYEVVGYDKYLNASAPKILGTAKVSHDGFISSKGWSVTTNMVSDQDLENGGEDDPDVAVKTEINKVIDGDSRTQYIGKSEKSNPEVIINLNGNEAVTGFKYIAGNGTPISKYKVYVSKDSKSWKEVKAGTFNLTNGEETVRFNKPGDSWLYTYDAAYVKLVVEGQRGADLSIGELSLIGPAGDNVELITNGIGTLKADYNAGQGADGQDVIIPKGSMIFTGSYKGNPAYNIVMLFDENDKIVGGLDSEGNILSDQIIFAPVPEGAELGNISEGTWLYYIEPQYLATAGFVAPTKVRAELYRVDDAHSAEGERLVSDTKFIDVPAVLPEIEIVP